MKRYMSKRRVRTRKLRRKSRKYRGGARNCPEAMPAKTRKRCLEQQARELEEEAINPKQKSEPTSVKIEKRLEEEAAAFTALPLNERIAIMKQRWQIGVNEKEEQRAKHAKNNKKDEEEEEEEEEEVHTFNANTNI